MKSTNLIFWLQIHLADTKITSKITFFYSLSKIITIKAKLTMSIQIQENLVCWPLEIKQVITFRLSFQNIQLTITKIIDTHPRIQNQWLVMNLIININSSSLLVQRNPNKTLKYCFWMTIQEWWIILISTCHFSSSFKIRFLFLEMEQTAESIANCIQVIDSIRVTDMIQVQSWLEEIQIFAFLRQQNNLKIITLTSFLAALLAPLNIMRVARSSLTMLITLLKMMAR